MGKFQSYPELWVFIHEDFNHDEQITGDFLCGLCVVSGVIHVAVSCSYGVVYEQHTRLLHLCTTNIIK